MTQASNLRPVGVSRRSRRGARSRNRGSIRLVYRSGGSTMWESAEMSLWVIIATLLLGQDGSGREPGVRRAPPRARTLRLRAPVVKAAGGCSLIEGVPSSEQAPPDNHGAYRPVSSFFVQSRPVGSFVS